MIFFLQVAGESFMLMDGVIGLALSNPVLLPTYRPDTVYTDRLLYFQVSLQRIATLFFAICVIFRASRVAQRVLCNARKSALWELFFVVSACQRRTPVGRRPVYLLGYKISTLLGKEKKYYTIFSSSQVFLKEHKGSSLEGVRVVGAS